jgi:hypothetical protein
MTASTAILHYAEINQIIKGGSSQQQAVKAIQQSTVPSQPTA